MWCWFVYDDVFIWGLWVFDMMWFFVDLGVGEEVVFVGWVVFLLGDVFEKVFFGFVVCFW